LFASEVACAGDGNLDKAVNAEDIANWVYQDSTVIQQEPRDELPGAEVTRHPSTSAAAIARHRKCALHRGNRTGHSWRLMRAASR
jgi:hypothetical protein